MVSAFADCRAVLFDYGNTLIEFGANQLRAQEHALKAVLSRYGSVDAQRLSDVRDRQISAPYLNGHRENDFETLASELLTDVLGIKPVPSVIAELVSARCEAFRGSVCVSEEVKRQLRALGSRFRLGLVSNYPCGKCVRDSLQALGLREILEVAVVSGDIGWCKPDRRPFQAALDALQLSPSAAVYVGDNWLADIQGAKTLGMRAVLTTEYVPYQQIQQAPTDHQPDACISTLSELAALLL
jgi:FMN phosphatase YigB (HAD superfamily)